MATKFSAEERPICIPPGTVKSGGLVELTPAIENTNGTTPKSNALKLSIKYDPGTWLA